MGTLPPASRERRPSTGRTSGRGPCNRAAGYDEYRVRRVVVHRLARLVQLGIRQSRYFGRAKTIFQLYLATTMVNLTLVVGRLGRTGRFGGGPTSHSVVRNIRPSIVTKAAASPSALRLGLL